MKKKGGKPEPLVKYVPSKASRLSAADADELGHLIARLTSEGDGDVARRLVEASKPKSASTHHLFDWDDREAATSWRLHQASVLIRSVEVVFERPDGSEDGRTRAFPSIHIGGGDRNYVPIQRVLSDRQLAEQLLEEAKAEALSWSRRHEALRQFVETHVMFEAIERFTARGLDGTGRGGEGTGQDGTGTARL